MVLVAVAQEVMYAVTGSVTGVATATQLRQETSVCRFIIGTKLVDLARLKRPPHPPAPLSSPLSKLVQNSPLPKPPLSLPVRVVAAGVGTVFCNAVLVENKRHEDGPGRCVTMLEVEAIVTASLLRGQSGYDAEFGDAASRLTTTSQH
jgi:hypothetical protein